MTTKTEFNKSKPVLAYQDPIQATHTCPTCGAPRRKHPRCKACGLFTGEGHWDRLCRYRGHKICSQCLVSWQRAERRAQHEISWRKFRYPDGGESQG